MKRLFGVIIRTYIKYNKKFNFKFFIPETLEMLNCFEMNCRPALLTMLNTSIKEFKNLETQEKVVNLLEASKTLGL
ncbi:unnamed protein product [Meloidogyne enterolobii]|uniref:Uncharacterized protein n=1 Tax=Meloidogyne enterolobii TaxID=390850 RepID=A0ACB1B1L8_MELEN